MSYDDASWHFDSVLEKGLDKDCAATHIGMFFAWLANRGMVDPNFQDVSPLVDRTVAPGRFLLDRCCGEIDEFMLTQAGAEFTAATYRTYLSSYQDIPAVAEYDESYAAADSWELYEAVAQALDEAYGLFKS
jgi:hypothetical protein